jgi:hypothetical protein
LTLFVQTCYRFAVRLLRLAVIVLGLAAVGAEDCAAQDECLVTVRDGGGDVADGGSICREAHDRACVFDLRLCLNQSDGGCAAARLKKKVKAKGRCGAVGKLQAKPDETSAVCGASVAIKVKTKKKGKREGKCTIRVVTKSADKPARRDVDKVNLVCKPNPGDCPAVLPSQTTTTLVPATTTTTVPCITACDCCALPISALFHCVKP